MKNKEKLHSIALAALLLSFLIFGSSVALAGTETRLTHGERLTASTAIYGTNVFWTETTANGVHAYDLATGKRTDISGNFAVDKINSYGNKVVWTGEDGDAVYMYDISSGNETKIASERYLPDIYGNYIVYTNTYNDDHKNDGIYLYDLNTNNETKIAAIYSYPVIYDKKVVWSQANSNNGYDIREYDISTHQTSTITTTSSVSKLDIYGNTVVWTGSNNVYMYDMASHKTTQITDSGNAYQPAIYSNWIVYTIGELYSGDIYTYDISTAKTTRITTSTMAYSPSIYGDRIVYADIRNPEYPDERDIYLYNLSSTVQNPPVAEFYANVTSGTVPLVVLFTDLSTGGIPTSWLWDFGDGINSKHAMNATHTFTKPGTYNVTLMVTNAAGNNSVTKPGYITITASSPTEKPVADFYSPEAEKVLNGTTDHGIYENEVVSFFDNSTGSPTSWEWDFGDGNTSTQKNPTHVYGKMSVYGMGGYTVNLTVTNSAGSDTISKYGYVLIGADEKTVPAHFSSNVTSGIAPLTVLFHDTTYSEATDDFAYFRIWDFGDGTKVEAVSDEGKNFIYFYVTHTYKKPGKYTVTLMSHDPAGKSVITEYNYITVIDPNAPVANFSSNVTEGYSPLTVQFNDLSQKATSRIWDFNGDGQPDSSDVNPIYVYADLGNYAVNLTVSNENGTASKTAIITVVIPYTPNPYPKSGGGTHSVGGGSPEPANNVQVKELSQAFVTNGKTVKFDFPKNATCVVFVSFDAKKTAGKTTTIAEQLKGKSTLVSELNAGEVYKYFNVWVGTGGFATSKNIENPVVCFKVEKAWIKDKKIASDSITLNRYSDKKWEQFPVTCFRGR